MDDDDSATRLYNTVMTATTFPSVICTPGVCGGKPHLAGTRIKVKHIYVWVEQMGMTPAQIVRDYPHLSMAAVHAALAYYWSHQDEIHQEIADEERFVADMQAKAAALSLKDKLAEFHGGRDESPSALNGRGLRGSGAV